VVIYDFEVSPMKGDPVFLKKWQDKPLLIVNTASQCGYTKQYKDLQEIYESVAASGKSLEILAFPCNQFGGQEPGSNEEILNFCETNYGVQFPVFQKINVRGKDAHPLFTYLSQALPGALGTTSIKWNFTKFFIDRQGNPIKRFAPQDTPKAVLQEIAEYL
jgi:glutathione peroxidase